jgi:uncharacterized protein (TIGR02271 family)
MVGTQLIRDDGPQDIQKGLDVVGSDGGKVGRVAAVHRGYVVVEKGMFFPTDYYVPRSAIVHREGDRLVLNVSKDQALHQGWDTMPADPDEQPVEPPIGERFAADTGMDTDATYAARSGGGAGDQGAAPAAPAPTEPTGDPTVDRGVASSAALTGAGAGGYASAAASGTQDETYAVGTNTDSYPVVDPEATRTTAVDPAPTGERVRARGTGVDHDTTAGVAFTEGVIEIPLRGELVDVAKQVRVAEEVELSKEAVRRTEQVGGTIRREEIHFRESVSDPQAASSALIEDDDSDLIREARKTSPADPMIPEPGLPSDPRNPR